MRRTEPQPQPICIIRYYRNAGTLERPAFAPPVVVGNQRIRLMIDATDWDSDGWMDVIAGAANGIVRVYLNTAGKKASGQPGVRR